ncbi:uncharacterized protein LOC131842096 [Achroia grisella]|uniref:uncharacterized protein LOC131842096 n=1 Tax=Achroia grisella TaxID=688607 RepID=UPI0027D2CED0|nr:uncharacterized protein LOC131842096 [Achroia grisella]
MTSNDAGVYRCQAGNSIGGLVILEVVADTDRYTVVKTKKRAYNQTSTMNNYSKLFQVFPGGLPCRSKFLPRYIRNIPTVQNRKNEIMIGMCKVACSTSSTLVLTRGVSGLSRAWQTAGRRWPAVQRIIFAPVGSPLIIRCPGSALRDMPLSWRVGTSRVCPARLRENSGGRLHLNARDHIVISTLQPTDSALYSCWENGDLAGTVKLVVWDGAAPRWNHRNCLITLVCGATFAWRLALRALRNKRRTIR